MWRRNDLHCSVRNWQSFVVCRIISVQKIATQVPDQSQDKLRLATYYMDYNTKTYNVQINMQNTDAMLKIPVQDRHDCKRYIKFGFSTNH